MYEGSLLPGLALISTEDREAQTLEGRNHYNSLLQFSSLVLETEGKRTQVSYVQVFFASQDDRELCRACNLLATKSNDQIEPGKECIKAIATQLSLASRRAPPSPNKL